MVFELVLALFLGILAGTITGLTPGIHINTLTALILTISSFLLLHLTPVTILIFIIALTITHTFLNFLPSIFLGSPDQDTGLSILPGHSLLLKGKGYQAVILTLYGSCLAIPIIFLSAPFFIFILPKISLYLKHIMFLIILTASAYLIAREKKPKLALIIFFLSGFLGLASSFISSNSLLPLLTGLFGSSSLITSIIKKEKIPKQEIKKVKASFNDLKKVGLSSVLAAPLCSFLPSLGASQAAVISSSIVTINKKRFLMLLGSINTIVAGLAFITLIAINKTRSGASFAVSQLITLTTKHLFLIFLTIFFSSIVSFFLTLKLAKVFSKNINKINYKYLSFTILIFLTLTVLIFSGFPGLLIFTTATSIGLTCILMKVKRLHLMGSLMLPTILFYLPL